MDCIRCKGNVRSQFSCGKTFCPLLQKFKNSMPKTSLNFSGSSPPDLFVGQYNYPNVFTGILAPAEHNENAEKLSSPESWFKEKLSIDNILKNRGSMIYSRFVSNIKKSNKLLETMQEVSMAYKPCDIEFILAKKPKISFELNNRTAPIGNPAPLLKATFQENPKIERKVDYVVSDYDLNATDALYTLYKKNNSISSMIKLLSAGLLGIKKQRKLVPTRWSCTSVDSILSKKLIQEIKYFSFIDKYLVFSGEYLGNHYEIVLLPRQWSFEVIESKMQGSIWNPNSSSTQYIRDYEDYYGRKKYAHNVTGAYYANRLAVTEYLKKIKKQASILVLREVKPSYYAPCGVGILRELTRDLFKKKPLVFNSLEESFNNIKQRLNLPLKKYISNSLLLNEVKKQTNLNQFM